MPRLVPLFIELVLLVVCLIDALQTPGSSMRNLPKWAWLMLIVLVPYAGPIGWLVAGRPRRNRGPATTPSPRPAFPSYSQHVPTAPDDDPEFLASLKRDAEHEALLKKWEADLKRREEELRKPHPDPDQDSDPKP
jgi:hypothetical protein